MKKKLLSAKLKLVLSHPFFTSMLLQQKTVITNTVPTFAVDGTSLFINETFSEAMSIEENIGVLVHEIMHLVLGHHWRRGNRNHRLWNEACDYAINPVIEGAGFKLPSNIRDRNGKLIFTKPLIDARFDGMSAEQIYHILEQEKEEKKSKGKNGKSNPNGNPSNGDPSNGDPTNSDANGDNGDEEDNMTSCGDVITAENTSEAETITTVQVANALATAKAQGKVPGFMERAISKLEPIQDWREILNRFLTQTCAKDYTFNRPNKRYIHSGLVLPTLHSKTFGKFILAVDTSGSISERECAMMVTEVLSVLSTLIEDKSDIELTVIYWDSIVQRVEVLTDPSDNPKPKGGGGTNPNVVFDYINDNNMEAEAVIFLTDGYMEPIYVETPPYNVLWGLIRQNDYINVPFGETFRVDFNH